ALTDDDVGFLTAETSIDRQYIQYLAESARHHVEAESIEQFVFYGLLRQNLPSTLIDLLSQELSTLRDALEKSSQNHVIIFLSSDAMDDIMARLRALQADHATTPGSETGEPSTLGDLLRTVLTDTDNIRAVAQLYIAHNRMVSDAFYDELTALQLFKNQQLADIRLALQLGEFTGTYVPLVRELQHMAKLDPLYAPVGDLSPFVRLTLVAWREVLHRQQANGEIIGAPVSVDGADIEERINNYAFSLNQQLEASFPSTTIVRRIEADTADDSPFKEMHADLTTFLGNNPGFNFVMQPLAIYLSTNAETKLAGVQNIDAFTTAVKAVQRVSSLVTDYAAIRTLISNGLNSAQAMVAVGEHTFMQQFAYDLGGIDKARAVFYKAKYVQSTAMTVYMKHAPAFQLPLPYVIGSHASNVQGMQSHYAAALPNWSTLFGSIEMCECRHCRSLYSPAAYLVDTLNFIRDAPNYSEYSPLQLLLQRRPDIAHIELTCENSHTPMPYVDLVNELLEANIATRNFVLDWNQDIVTNLDLKTIDISLLVALADQKYVLTDKASVRIESSVSKWSILDKGWVFEIRNDGELEGLSVTTWPQTSWSEKELKANPEHTHSAAYEKLRSAVYPWRQPFNLPVEEARIYLQHLRVQRHELLEVFKRGALPNTLAEIAYEYLGLTFDEAQIINGNTTGGPANSYAVSGAWDFWGLSENNNYITDPVDPSVGEIDGGWLEVLNRVSVFLHQSGLSYRELLNLLETYYVNPSNADGPNERSLAIIAADDSDPATCNTARLIVYAHLGNDGYIEAWDHAHRFVRLVRKLGWTYHELDKALTALAPSRQGVLDITNDFLVQLSHIQRLSVEKHIPVVNLLSLWADIDHRRYSDHLADGEPVVPSLYVQMFRSKTLGVNSLPEDPAQLNNQKISEHFAVLSAAFGIAADEVQL
ncbi:MAG: hypothetical protein HYZ31_06120, partial [Gammaproteobacteria bacterium]|nr:hypothetical protein [Gammaproteobacteria bacterium]